MDRVSRTKGGGYLTSIVSVILLGIPALKSASESTVMLLCLLAGMVLSIAGMALRWQSHRQEQAEKDAQERKTEAIAARLHSRRTA
jgi:sensor domain CHASE-containing protein